MEIQKPKSTPRDVFLHLLSIVTLYAAATAFLTLTFQLINLWFPDLLEMRGSYAFAGARSTLRWALASFVIVFPVYFAVTRFLRKEYEAIPEKRELKVRKWLVSFTLFVVALTIISDLVSLLSHFLEGELTTRFVLKVLVVGFVASAIGAYYLWILKGRAVTPGARYAVSGILMVVFAGVVAGFFFAGSPAEERLRRFDEQRVQNLQMIQSEIITYWQAKKALPASFDELLDPIRGAVIPRDPATGAPYRYEKKGPLLFALCGVFARANQEDATPYAGDPRFSYPPPSPIAKPYMAEPFGYGENWAHGEGEICFDRAIDPDRYQLPPR